MAALKISPSKMSLVMECPGSARMSAPYKWEDSEAASRGRNLHDAMALLFQVGTGAFKTIKANPNLAEADVAVLPEVFKLGLSQKPSDEATQVIVEEAVDCKFMGIEGGKPDLVFLSEAQKVAVIIDWKFGQRPVEDVSINKQLIAYACAFLAKYPFIETVETVIIQPFGAVENWASTHTWTKAELREQAKILMDAAAAARAPQAECIAGNHCFSMFCAARKDGETKEGAPLTACPAYTAYKQRIADGKADEKRVATEALVMPTGGDTEAVSVIPEAPITGPFYIATADTIALAKEKRDFALALRVVDGASADIAGRTRIELGKLSKLVKDNREALNAPLLALQRAMIAREKEVTGPLDEAAEHLKAQVSAFVEAENKRKAAELAAQEKKRRDAEAAQRLAEAEAQRKQAEALAEQRKAEEEMERASLLKTKAAREKAEAAARESQKRAQEAQRQALEEEEKMLRAQRDQEQAEADAQAALQPTAKIAGFRTEESQEFSIPDFSKVPAALMEVVLMPNEKVIKQMIKTGALNEAKHGAWLTITRGTKALGSR